MCVFVGEIYSMISVEWSEDHLSICKSIHFSWTICVKTMFEFSLPVTLTLPFLSLNYFTIHYCK